MDNAASALRGAAQRCAAPSCCVDPRAVRPTTCHQSPQSVARRRCLPSKAGCGSSTACRRLRGRRAGCAAPSSSPAAADRCSSMRATYACGESSATSSSTSISLTTAARELGLVLGDEQDAACASPAGPDHSIITGTPAVSSRRRSTCACTLGPLADLDETAVVAVDVVAVEGRVVGHERDPAVGARAWCRRGTRLRTTGTTRSVRQPRAGVYGGASVR